MIIPVMKKGEGKKVQEYRVSITPTLYLHDRVCAIRKTEGVGGGVKRKELVLQNQTELNLYQTSQYENL